MEAIARRAEGQAAGWHFETLKAPHDSMTAHPEENAAIIAAAERSLPCERIGFGNGMARPGRFTPLRD